MTANRPGRGNECSQLCSEVASRVFRISRRDVWARPRRQDVVIIRCSISGASIGFAQDDKRGV